MANTIARISAVLVALLASSCAGDDETPKSAYSEPCGTMSDCAQNLQCFTELGICSQGCSTMQECRTNLQSPTSVCVGGVCQEPCDATQYMACSEYGLDCVTSFSGSTCRQQ